MRLTSIAGLSAATLCAFSMWIAPLQGRSRQAPQKEEQLDRLLRAEGEAVLELADQASTGKRVPADFRVHWESVFLKAQKGTFVPFTLTMDAAGLRRPAALVYVRAVRQGSSESGRSPAAPARASQGDSTGALDVVFPVELTWQPGEMARVHRGLVLDPGDYQVFVVVRERADPSAPGRSKAAVLIERMEVPDLWSGGLTTSSLILADRVHVLPAPVEGEEIAERPFVIGQHEITPAVDRRFRPDEELIVVFLIYNPFVTLDRQFDLLVEYHFFRKAGSPGRGSVEGLPARRPAAKPGEQYVNHTDPQRFTPATLGPRFDPVAGQPVMAGQGVPLAGFEAGEYRLAIEVTDRLAGRSVVRDVEFTVGP